MIPLNIPDLSAIIRRALAEDHVRRDVTTQQLIDRNDTAVARIIVREKAVVCGLPIVRQVFQELDRAVKCRFLCAEGKEVKKNTTVMVLKGRTRALLSAERTALNFLGYLSGIATTARRYVQAVHPFKVEILDTRKTTPALRVLEKYAVRCGGAQNHRANLEDMILVKDNHRWACRRMTTREMIQRLRQVKRRTIEFEADTLAEFEEALEWGADMILLDNMSCAQMKRAVALRNKKAKKDRPLLEASGGITLKNIKKIAQTGVDRISVGALTHSRRSADVSMELSDA